MTELKFLGDPFNCHQRSSFYLFIDEPGVTTIGKGDGVHRLYFRIFEGVV